MATILSFSENTIEVCHKLLYYSYDSQHTIVQKPTLYIWSPNYLTCCLLFVLM
jgi:hypothetical protein